LKILSFKENRKHIRRETHLLIKSLLGWREAQDSHKKTVLLMSLPSFIKGEVKT
jgi:hypothetical protein